MSGETESQKRSGTGSTPQTRRAQNRAETREAIFRSAVRLFSEQGFDETTVPEIATSAGVSRATVFRYFPSKEDILFAHTDDEIRAMRAALREHPAASTDRDEMCAALLSFVQYVEQERHGLAQRFGVVQSHPELKARSLAVRAAFGRAFADELAGGREAGIREHVIASGAVAALVLTVRQWYEDDTRSDLRALLEQALDALSFDDAPTTGNR